ncbi:hypothetical protein KDL01_00355 [Actinospica durhamensis]|uniref:PKD domain-containing protein n=1 Tax=Actinospica durhamensis TaxID=1508375 RepID=A0A941IN60_9ACTN|nr:PKD domain-containing protein [Actinospica durhamensis]MBR7831687.1 hypothetical protein [Actinospica durhamensis]
MTFGLLPGSAYAAGATTAASASSPGNAGTALHVAQTPSLTSTAFKKFSSPASQARRVASTSGKAAARASADDSAGVTTIYAGNPQNCLGFSSDSGTGTATNPYCSIQDAVNAALPGDTISIANGYGYFYGPVVIGTSDLTLEAPNGAAIENSTAGGVPGFVLDGVDDVHVSGLSVSTYDSVALEIEGSTNVVFDSGAAFGGGGSTAVTIDGASSGITITRSQILPRYDDPADSGVRIASGASTIDLASNVFADFPSGSIVATGVDGLDVVGNTIQRSCDSAVGVSGGSTGVYIENDVFIDGTDLSPSSCPTDNLSWEPDVTVDASSASASTSDYNDFALYGSADQYGTAPYSWAGTTYATLTGFRGAVSEGVHDTPDTTTFGMLNAAGTWYNMQAVPAWNSPAVGSANASAPGAVSTDLYGRSPYNSRGAIQFEPLFPNLNETPTLTQTGPYSVTATDTGNYGPSAKDGLFTLTFNWGDGTSTTQALTIGSGSYGSPIAHTYSAYGSYTVTFTLDDNAGDKVTKTLTTVLSDPDPNLAAGLGMTGEDTSALSVAVDTATAYPAISYGLALVETYTWGDGTTSTVASSAGLTTPTSHTYKASGTYTVQVQVTDNAGDTAVNSMSVTTAGSEYTPYGPTRILDTRSGLGAPAALGSGKVLHLKVAGAGPAATPIPDDITAVVLNVTAVSPSANGFLAVYGNEDVTGASVSVPGTSNLNFFTGVNVPNLVVVPVGADGVVDFYNGSPKGSVQVLADVAGYFTQTAASAYKSITPVRILDTRKGTGTGKVAQIPANGSITLTVAGAQHGAVPASGVSAVALNLTAVDSTRNGVITAYPAGRPLPTVSNVNYLAGQTVANMAIVPLGNGQIVLHNNSSGPVDLIADAFGYYSSTVVAGGGAYLPMSAPERILDTRRSGDGPVPAGSIGYVELSSLSYVTAWVFNATVTQTTGNGFLALYPFAPQNPYVLPTTSNLNYRSSQTVPNLAIVQPGTSLDSDGYYDVGIYLGGNGTAQVILDCFGVFEDQ